MNVKKFLSAFTSATVGLSMLLGTGVTQAFASAIDSDAFTPVRYSNQTVTTTVSGDAAATTTTATTTGILTTTTTTTTDDGYNCPEYPFSGEKVVSINIVDEDTGFSIYGDIDVIARLLTSEDINNDTEGVEIASWNLNEENIQPYALTVPYTVEYAGQMLFIGVYIDNYTDIAYNDIQDTLFIFEPLSNDASYMYEVPLEQSYVTTLAPLDYCEGCGKDLAEGEGVRTVLGMFLCNSCVKAGMGGTTTPPPTTTTTTPDCVTDTGILTTTTAFTGTGTTTVWTGTTVFTTTTDFFDGEEPVYPVTFYKDIEIEIVNQDTGHYFYEDAEFSLIMVSGKDGTNRTVITEWNTAEKNTFVVEDVEVTVESADDQVSFIIAMKEMPQGYTMEDTWITLTDDGYIVEYIVTDNDEFECFTYYLAEENPEYTETTLPAQDYCDICNKDLEEGEGVRTPLGLFICDECDNAGMGGTTTAPYTTTTAPYTTTTPVSTTTTNHAEGTGTTTTATTTTTVTTTTTIHYDYRTELEYDSSEMKVGETRAIYFYNAYSGVGEEPFIGEASENISYEYVEGTNVIYITALSAGNAKLYIREGTCAFGDYVNITITEETEEGTSDCISYEYGDADMDGQVKMNDVIIVLCHACNPEKYPLDQQIIEQCDVYQTGDGIDTSDALMIQKLVAQIITEFSVG